MSWTYFIISRDYKYECIDIKRRGIAIIHVISMYENKIN
jgi:hypothetical protein